jgi:hypothetical protein
LGERAQPFRTRLIDTILALDTFHDDRRRQIEPARGIVELLLEEGDRVDVGTVVALLRQKGHAGQRDRCGAALLSRRRRRESAKAMSVVTVRERDHVRALGPLARELDRSLHGIRSGGARELQFVAKPARREYEVAESVDELSLRSHREIETIDDTIA